MDNPIEEAVSQVLSECCNKPNATEQEMIYFLSRVQESAKPDTPSAPASEDAPSRTLGTSFQTFLSSLDAARILLWACQFDYQRADYFYSVVDSSVANQIIKDFVSSLHEQNTYLFEAVLYGFGGKYSEENTSGLDENTIDARDMDIASLSKLLMG